jgi:hypothetical protein
MCDSGRVRVPEWLQRFLPGTPPTVPWPGGKPEFDRLIAYVYRRFSDPQRVLASLRDLPDEVYGGQDRERIQAALVLAADGSWEGFERSVALARVEWRDALVAGGLANADWPKRLDAALGD